MIRDAGAFGQLVRQRRQALGLTQRDLAIAINTGERFIVDLEAGKATCQLGKALTAASAVGIQLMDGKDQYGLEPGTADDPPGAPEGLP